MDDGGELSGWTVTTLKAHVDALRVADQEALRLLSTKQDVVDSNMGQRVQRLEATTGRLIGGMLFASVVAPFITAIAAAALTYFLTH